MVYSFIVIIFLALYLSARTSYMAYQSDLLDKKQVYFIIGISWLVPFIGAILISSLLKPELHSREEAVKSKWDWIFWSNPKEHPHTLLSDEQSHTGSSVSDVDN